MNKQTIILAILLVSFAVLSRFLPHPVNFAPLGALGLYAGTFFVDKRYWLLPVVALLLSDALLGFYHWISMLFVYAGFVFAVIIGRIGPGKKLSAFRFGMAVFLGANIFFILSNFGTWLSGTLYPLTLGGLVSCYIAAIPFYGNTLLGDLVYAGLLFDLHLSAQHFIANKQTLHNSL